MSAAATISSIVTPGGRVKAYANLETSRTTSEVIGPAIASALHSVMGVAALLVDAASLLFSAGNVRAMKLYGGGAGRQERMWTRLKRGIHLNWGDPVLRGSSSAAARSIVVSPHRRPYRPIMAWAPTSLWVSDQCRARDLR